MAGSDDGDGMRAPQGDARLPGMLANEWSAAVRTAFLDTLAASGSADAAARAAGVSLAGAYVHRRRNAAFAADWQQALAATYDRLEAAVIAALTGGGAKMDMAVALTMLERRPGAVERPAATRSPAGTRSRSEAELLRRLKAYARRTGTPEPR